MREFKVQDFIEAFLDSGGIIKDVAHKLGCDRQAVVDAISKYPDVRAAFELEREKLTDLVESRLIEQISQGNMTAISYYLDRKGASRGYGKPEKKSARWGSENG